MWTLIRHFIHIGLIHTAVAVLIGHQEVGLMCSKLGNSHIAKRKAKKVSLLGMVMVTIKILPMHTAIS